MSTMHIYDSVYYKYINVGSLRSAQTVLPIVARYFTVRSVADFGAGQGAWLAAWQRLGVSDIAALDGSYVDHASLLIPTDKFVSTDLSQQVRLGRTFDLVQSLEVAEHLPTSAAETFVDNLVAHAPIVLFSAAAPGQGGEHHVNEQPYSYWRRLFSARDYVMLDVIRSSLAASAGVEAWYRYNTFVYVHRERLAAMPAGIQRFQIHDKDRIPDVSPVRYRVRKLAIRFLPVWAVTLLAVMKKQYHVGLRPTLGLR
jgi:hypothetical protein